MNSRRRIVEIPLDLAVCWKRSFSSIQRTSHTSSTPIQYMHSLYIPSLSNEEDRIKGLDGYQHPNRSKIVKLSPKSDYFSELIIYLSLLVISEKPSFWKNIEKEETLLLSKADLINPRSSPTFAQLTNSAQFSLEVIYYYTRIREVL